MRNSNLACGLTTGQLIANKDRDKRMIPFMYGAYGEAAETDWHMDRRGGGRGGGGGFAELMADHWTSLSATSRPLLAQNAHRSLMACYIALDSRGAKGQVCLKFALPCISGDDLDFLSLAPPRDGAGG